MSRRLSWTEEGSFTNAALGAVSGVVVDVTQRIPSAPSAFTAVQPAGNAGATTPSKFSAKAVVTTSAPYVPVIVAFGKASVPSSSPMVAVQGAPQLPTAVQEKFRVAEPPGGIMP